MTDTETNTQREAALADSGLHHGDPVECNNCAGNDGPNLFEGDKIVHYDGFTYCCDDCAAQDGIARHGHRLVNAIQSAHESVDDLIDDVDGGHMSNRQVTARLTQIRSQLTTWGVAKYV